MKMKKLAATLLTAILLVGSTMSVSATPLPEAPAFDFESLEGIEKGQIKCCALGIESLPLIYEEPDSEFVLSKVEKRDVYIISKDTRMTKPIGSTSTRLYIYKPEFGYWYLQHQEDEVVTYRSSVLFMPSSSINRTSYEVETVMGIVYEGQEYLFMQKSPDSSSYTVSDGTNSVPTPATYTVTDVSAVFYTGETTVVYADAALDSQVVLPAVGAKLPVLVTGVTSNGFFKVDLGTGVSYYIPGYGLTEN